MYILIDAKTNIIVGTAVKAVSNNACNQNGQKIYEIPDHEFTMDMIGSKLENFVEDNTEL